MMPEVSILVPARNEAHCIGRQLEALAALRTRHAHEVIVADHGSTDLTAVIVNGYRERMPRLRLIDASAVRRVGGVRNCAAAAAEGTFFAFCDADDVVDAGWLEALIDAADDRDVLVRGAVLSGNGMPLNGATSTGEIPAHAGYLPYADTCSMGIAASAFRATGGFDDSMPRSSDADFSWRAMQHGVPIVDAPYAVVYKSMPGTIHERATQCFGWGRAQAALYRRHRDSGMPARGLRDLYDDVHEIAVAAVRGRAQPETVVSAGWAAGRLAGSLVERVWYP
jgi:glycosyltransferase involved in cell wall biosynthesis